MARETALWNWLRKARKELRSDLHMERVENGAASGTPDVEGLLTGGSQFWIELKSAPRPKRGGPVRFKVRAGQVEWLRRRCAVGGRAYLLLQVGSGASARRYLVWGDYAASIMNGVSEDRLGTLRDNLDGEDPADLIRRAAGV